MKATLAGHLAYECECGSLLHINYVRQQDQMFVGKHLVCHNHGCKWNGVRLNIPTVQLEVFEDKNNK